MMLGCPCLYDGVYWAVGLRNFKDQACIMQYVRGRSRHYRIVSLPVHAHYKALDAFSSLLDRRRRYRARYAQAKDDGHGIYDRPCVVIESSAVEGPCHVAKKGQSIVASAQRLSFYGQKHTPRDF